MEKIFGDIIGEECSYNGKFVAFLTQDTRVKGFFLFVYEILKKDLFLCKKILDPDIYKIIWSNDSRKILFYTNIRKKEISVVGIDIYTKEEIKADIFKEKKYENLDIHFYLDKNKLDIAFCNHYDGMINRTNVYIINTLEYFTIDKYNYYSPDLQKIIINKDKKLHLKVFGKEEKHLISSDGNYLGYDMKWSRDSKYFYFGKSVWHNNNDIKIYSIEEKKIVKVLENVWSDKIFFKDLNNYNYIYNTNLLNNKNKIIGKGITESKNLTFSPIYPIYFYGKKIFFTADVWRDKYIFFCNKDIKKKVFYMMLCKNKIDKHNLLPYLPIEILLDIISYYIGKLN